ncbi:PaaI family thioesterase [Sphingomonas sp. NFR15]|uniref:PaaI family thioesterase n=1 Tax=Sphingomonas sp. NFR15 TaxID=1566282 RepID=UPI00088A4407|nr:PaaI family thioesterase [Sphingomonas sp. NFR15]SDA35955.1 uncharacterized domain 1-containing protein [Sphingomonas sp. NFR15]
MLEYSIPREVLRTRIVEWHDASVVPALVAGLSGLEIMRGIRDGVLPAPPMARLLGFRCVVAEPGEVAMRLDHDPSIENTMGMLHGGAAATVLDTAMGCAAHTTLPQGNGIVTLDLNVTYLRPITVTNAPVTATGRVINAGRRVIYVTGEVKDRDGALVAHAVGNFSIVGARA